MIGRIILPKKSGMLLNERFSHLSELRDQPGEPVALVQPAPLFSTESNVRLARELERRASVQQALGLGAGNAYSQRQQHQQPAAHRADDYDGIPDDNQFRSGAAASQKRMHVKQRLAIQARLGALHRNEQPSSGTQRAGPGRGRGRSIVNRLQLTRGSPTGRASSRGSRGTVFGRGRGGTLRGGRGGAEGGTLRGGRGGAVRSRGGRGRATPVNNNTRGRGGQITWPVTREDLDKQLDEYMSGTKTHLDAELDHYMKDVEK